MFKKTYIQSTDINHECIDLKKHIQDTGIVGGKNALENTYYTGKMHFFKREKRKSYEQDYNHFGN